QRAARAVPYREYGGHLLRPKLFLSCNYILNSYPEILRCSIGCSIRHTGHLQDRGLNKPAHAHKADCRSGTIPLSNILLTSLLGLVPRVAKNVRSPESSDTLAIILLVKSKLCCASQGSIMSSQVCGYSPGRHSLRNLFQAYGLRSPW